MYYTVEQFLLLFNRLRKLLDEEIREVIITDKEAVAKYKKAVRTHGMSGTWFQVQWLWR
jgi:hypothetical protein